MEKKKYWRIIDKVKLRKIKIEKKKINEGEKLHKFKFFTSLLMQFANCLFSQVID